MDHQQLLVQAHSALQYAYSPYSKFQVGVALLGASGKVYLGCNVENASFGATICAERVAMATAIAQGERTFQAIAIIGSHDQFTYPCGICRQFIAEFALDITVVLQQNSKIKTISLRSLLPEAFVGF